MKTQPIKTNSDRYLPARFGPDVEFELTPTPGSVSPDAVRLKFQELQNRLIEETFHEAQNPRLRENLYCAANEAAALAWTTPYPLLLMPALFQEKARTTRLRMDKQNRILMQSEPLVEAMNDSEGQSVPR